MPSSERRPENGGVLFFLLVQLCATLIDLLCIARLSSDDKDPEILILRKQLDILARKQAHTVRRNGHWLCWRHHQRLLPNADWTGIAIGLKGIVGAIS